MVGFLIAGHNLPSTRRRLACRTVVSMQLKLKVTMGIEVIMVENIVSRTFANSSYHHAE